MTYQQMPEFLDVYSMTLVRVILEVPAPAKVNFIWHSWLLYLAGLSYARRAHATLRLTL